MNNIYKKFEKASIALFAMASTMAWAVNDLPGGPAVRQLNLHPPVTKIAEDVIHHGDAIWVRVCELVIKNDREWLANLNDLGKCQTDKDG